MTRNLEGQVAVITGASQGIGQAIARKLAALGIHLVLSARNEGKLQFLAGQLKESHPEVKTLVLPCDVQDAGQVQQVADDALRQFKRIDILINNAGVAPRLGLLQEMSLEDINRTIDTNLKGAIYAMRAVLPAMIQQHGGTIININSIAGKTAYPYWSIYDASKFGLHAITQAVAEEQRHNNIKVVGIYPGAVSTPIWDGLEPGHEPDLNGMLDAETIAESVAYVLQQPRKAFISDITLSPLQPVL
jgi:NADP-dependent 3-hydroxy acid dehydrogenase YdfG